MNDASATPDESEHQRIAECFGLTPGELDEVVSGAVVVSSVCIEGPRGQLMYGRTALRNPYAHPPDDWVTHYLGKAVAQWFADRAVPHPFDAYSTVGNEFLHAAESAWFDFVREWQEAHPDEPDPGPPSSGCHLYRLFGEDDRLLYVGVSRNVRARLRAHRRRWGDLITRVTTEEHPDEASMLAAERAAIADELPAFNVAGV